MPNVAAEWGKPIPFDVIAVPIAGTVSFPLIIGWRQGGRRLGWRYNFGSSPATLDLRLQGFIGPAGLDPNAAGNSFWGDLDVAITVAGTVRWVALNVNVIAVRLQVIAITGAPTGFESSIYV